MIIMNDVIYAGGYHTQNQLKLNFVVSPWKLTKQESIGSDSNRENPANDEQMSETSHTSLSLVLY